MAIVAVSRKQYLEDVLRINPNKEERYLKTMAKYEEDWWNSSDPKKIAKFQLDEPVLLVRLAVLQDALEKVLRRAVSCSELHSSNEALKAEVATALKA
ncbi:MAG: hypothetical protein IJ217_05675 [Clostridia bacterium]|nr:hypothetical protein [Clostridia bacterium]